MIDAEVFSSTEDSTTLGDSARALTLAFAEAKAFGDYGLFFRAWLRHPAIIGAIMPTRAPLAEAMAGAAATVGCKAVLELGGGTGSITRALIDSGIAPENLTIIERNPLFHRLLTRRFPSLRILYGDAVNLGNTLGMNDKGRLDVVVSSLPRIGWPLARQRSILEQCFALLRADGVFLEFSYGPFSPVPRTLVNGLGLVARRVRHVWSNFPPATVWGYQRASALR